MSLSTLRGYIQSANKDEGDVMTSHAEVMEQVRRVRAERGLGA